MPPVFDSKKCVKCGRCVKDCPGYILELDKEHDETPPVKYVPINQFYHYVIKLQVKFRAVIPFQAWRAGYPGRGGSSPLP